MTLKFALISDIHYGEDRVTKKGSIALPVLEKIVNAVNSDKSEFIVELGDRIAAKNREQDKENTKIVQSVLNKLTKPVYYLFGNHEQYFMLPDDHEEIIGQKFLSFVVDTEDYSLIFWNTLTTDKFDPWSYNLNENDFEWLSRALANLNKLAMIFTHMPLNEANMKGNFYCQLAPRNPTSFVDIERVTDLISKSGKVICCFSGHAHWHNLSTIDGVHYINLPSVTETFITHPEIASAYTNVEIDTEIRVKVHGNDPRTYHLPIRQIGHHWIKQETRENS